MTDKLRTKNFFALGFTYWVYGRPLEPTIEYINEKWAKKLPDVADANIRVLKAGYFLGETTETTRNRYMVARAEVEPGTYRKISGNDAIALGLIAGAKKAGRELLFSGYPITPASSILEALAGFKHFGIKTVQAEDEIAAIGVALGASFAGQIGVTATSGPGMCLKSEFIGLAISTELPLVIVNVQRGGPSTGLPTKTEQSDLLAGALRPPRREPAAGRRRQLAVRLFPRRLRGRPHRARILDAGHPAHRRLSGQWFRAMENPRRRLAAGNFQTLRRSGQALRHLRPRSGNPRPHPGHPRPARLEHRIGGLEKDDKGLHQLRLGKPQQK